MSSVFWHIWRGGTSHQVLPSLLSLAQSSLYMTRTRRDFKWGIIEHQHFLLVPSYIPRSSNIRAYDDGTMESLSRGDEGMAAATGGHLWKENQHISG
ncbi:hypothetical protein ARMGADRAFT_543567 [Armillaria gallica]|uniref:Uncharacterized protein n=1 Tax=Armillaria gallica TaxID=47427 RepID=A0A2H3CS90_ARMGA|nr:hypothetical protein ARMGADRAFT_543567 [Armillaria gallica]